MKDKSIENLHLSKKILVTSNFKGPCSSNLGPWGSKGQITYLDFFEFLSKLVVIPYYSILNYSIARIFFFKDPGCPGDSNSKISKIIRRLLYRIRSNTNRAVLI